MPPATVNHIHVLTGQTTDFTLDWLGPNNAINLDGIITIHCVSGDEFSIVIRNKNDLFKLLYIQCVCI